MQRPDNYAARCHGAAPARQLPANVLGVCVCVAISTTAGAEPRANAAKCPQCRRFASLSRALAVLHRGVEYVSNPLNFAGATPRVPDTAVPFSVHGPTLVVATGGRLRRKIEPWIVAGEDAIIAGMAGRYATALFELAREAGAIDAVQADLDAFDALLAGTPDLVRLVRSPVFSADEQAKALTAVLERTGIDGLAANFLKVVTANRRLFAVRGMIKAFRALAARHRGEVTAEVAVAERLSEVRISEIKDTLRSVTGKDVQLSVRVDPAIIGGLIVKLGSRMVDSSLRTKLNAIKHAMKEAG